MCVCAGRRRERGLDGGPGWVYRFDLLGVSEGRMDVHASAKVLISCFFFVCSFVDPMAHEASSLCC